MRTKNFRGIGFLAHAAGAYGGAPADRRSLWLGLVLVVLCAVYASYSRLGQLSAWYGDLEQYIASGVPMMTTLDAYYSLRLARLHAAGKFVPWGPAPARHYSRPELGDPSEWYDQREPKILPLLSRVLADAAVLFEDDIDKTALVLSPLLSSFFMIPLFWYFWRIGVPAAGLMGGLVATFCIEYYRRTGVGWIDTDCLNLFFPWTVSCLILAMHGELRRQTLLLMSAAAGTALYLFYLWYGKPALILAYVVALVVHLSLAGVSLRRILLCAATMIVFANPIQLGSAIGSLQDFLQRYLWPSAASTIDSSAVRFPQVWSTISEARSLPWRETLKQILQRADLAVVGLSAFALFAVWRWRAIPALSPILLLGAFALPSSRRFILYLAPFVGIGWGVIVCLITKALLNRLDTRSDDLAPQTSGSAAWIGAARSLASTATFQTGVAYVAVIVVFFVWFAPAPANLNALRPAIPAQVFRNLPILAKQLPANSRMWTWWDNGFAIVDATGFGVYHDGSAQYTPQTNLIAASFVDSNPRAMQKLIAFVDREGNQGIRRLAASAKNFNDLLERVPSVSPQPLEVPVYVLYTPDMLLKYSAMRYLGGADGNPAAQRGSVGIRWLPCERLVDEKAYCSGQIFDLRTGAIELQSGASGPTGKPVSLRRVVMIEGGRSVRRRDYNADNAQLTMEMILSAGKVIGVYLLDEPAFQSNLNQMFMLGRFDGELFEEVYNDFPYARAFRVRAKPQ
jgi:dolichyl-diphosphooligosaccharide--protein glycosyltransferase